MKYRFADFLIKVMRRDGYECILTGSQDSAHPDPAEEIFTTDLVVAHILRRAVGQFDKDPNSDSVRHLPIQSRKLADWMFFLLYPV
jgi:hypothetical protein